MSYVLPKDSISRFMNWFNNLGKDKPLINRANGSHDIFSKFMNRISN
ncbi:ferredoxin--nitrite reductase [Prochlorococcus marinus XMU1403]|nr:Ferredoxin--nitrite reductase [Prochlorococcus sp. MIT 0801]PYE00569.1 ferredoxin--nitrite reductase [Prochlorococcus marinus XMU1403]